MALHQPYDPYYVQQPEYVFAKDTGNTINTLFVAGLPDDVKAREIHNLFRRRPGFDYCQLKYTGRGNQVVAFAIFVNHQSAMAAMHALNGVTFDPQTGSTLHIELARSNSTRLRKPGDGAYVVIDRRTKASTDAHDTSSDDGENETDDPLGPNVTDSVNKDDSEIAKSDQHLLGWDASATLTISANIIQKHELVPSESNQILDQTEKTDIEGAQYCSTLFIANLGPSCTEDELKQVLSQYPGFNALKVRARSGMPVAFADFEAVEQANEAKNALQGSSLPSSDRGGMHIEYARSKMRKP